jgi:predicted RND superfamily exporter protein
MARDLTMMSLFGLVALSGVVVNDSLVLLDFINRSVSRGTPIFQAVLAGGQARFRAIVLTSLTTVAGLLPILAEKSFQAQFLIPMAISISFGLMGATLLTLFLVPALYLLLNDVWRILHWLRTGDWPLPEEVEAHRIAATAEISAARGDGEAYIGTAASGAGAEDLRDRAEM